MGRGTEDRPSGKVGTHVRTEGEAHTVRSVSYVQDWLWSFSVGRLGVLGWINEREPLWNVLTEGPQP